MGWFEEQIRQRRQNDEEMLQDAFADLSRAAGDSKTFFSFESDSRRADSAVREILAFYHAKMPEIPDSVKELSDRLEYVTRPNGIMRRTVKLAPGWYKSAAGAMLAAKKGDGRLVALIPSRLWGYTYFDEKKGKRARVNWKNQDDFESEAIAFYPPLPLKEIGARDLLRFIWSNVSASDRILVAAAALAAALIGLLSPALTRILLSSVIESGKASALLGIAVFMACVSISGIMMNSVKTVLVERIAAKTGLFLQAAIMTRVLSLPAGFFAQYSSGNLASRAQTAQALCNMLVSLAFSCGLTALFSLVYLVQIFAFAPSLVAAALIVIVATAAAIAAASLIQSRLKKETFELNAKESGLSYSLITGVQKIKLVGAEDRAFAKWGHAYAKAAKIKYNPPMIVKANSAITLAISLAGTMAMYFFAMRASLSVADYYAFNTAFGMLSAAFTGLPSIVDTASSIKPMAGLIAPILKAQPEVSERKLVVERLLGGIELSRVSFRYSENMPLVLDNLSLKIRPGQYVAIVGPTGCGKSTLMRLLLGFEKPQKGAVFYDGRDIASLDLKSLRRKMGVVIQDGKLFSGDIYSNITISAPHLTLDEAWEAAELAGIADDIRQMPMGMYTLISEGAGGISGGQRQRLLIARAIAPKPKILLFDEATSALDNITQKKVSQSLDSLKCTRVVIAHRLSTIKQCDRIVYLEGGRIVEDGTYDELAAKNGKFAELVARQQIDQN